MVRLDLSKNKLKFLTEDFCNLVNLKHLDLYSNQLENLPVSFGKLNKLRYLDLKGNPLQPALQKIVGPCLTIKDCANAAKQILPYMIDLEVKFRAEQEKREEELRRRREEEEAEAREQVRLAKKAARKERVMRERQEKAEAEKISGTAQPAKTSSGGESKSFKSEVKPPKSESPAQNFTSFLKTLLAVVFLFVAIFFMFRKFLPEQTEKVLAVLPQHQQTVLRAAYEKIDGGVFGLFQKVLNLYKM